MKHWIRVMAATVAVTGTGLAAQQAQACGVPSVAGFKPTAFADRPAGALVLTDFRPGTPFGPAAPFAGGGPFNTSQLAGLFRHEWYATKVYGPTTDVVLAGPLPDGPPAGPNPGVLLADSGFTTFHDDGTELGDGSRAPVAGSICVGAWKQTGPLTYAITHWGFSWVPGYQPGVTSDWGNDSTGVGTTSGGIKGPDQAFHPAGPANILEQITLARDGNSASGTFLLTQYNPQEPGKPPFDTSAGITNIIEGRIYLCRVVAGPVQPRCPYGF